MKIQPFFLIEREKYLKFYLFLPKNLRNLIHLISERLNWFALITENRIKNIFAIIMWKLIA